MSAPLPPPPKSSPARLPRSPVRWRAPAKIASKAVADAERTNATVQALSTGAEKIGEVVKLIHLDRRANQPAGAERHHRGGARR